MNSFVDPLNIVLMIAAVIIFWRLKSVLGARTGLERPPVDFKLPQANAPAKPQTEADEERVDVAKPPVWTTRRFDQPYANPTAGWIPSRR